MPAKSERNYKLLKSCLAEFPNRRKLIMRTSTQRLPSLIRYLRKQVAEQTDPKPFNCPQVDTVRRGIAGSPGSKERIDALRQYYETQANLFDEPSDNVASPFTVDDARLLSDAMRPRLARHGVSISLERNDNED